MTAATSAVWAAVIASAALLASVAIVAAGACAQAGDPPVPAANDGESAPLILTRSVSLPGVKGRIDHFTLDAKRKRLFVAALGNGSVEVISLEKHEHLRSLGPFEEPQGIAFLAAQDRLAVACGGDGSVRFFDGEKLDSAARVDLGADADNAHIGAGGILYVAYGNGGLAALDPATGAVKCKVALDAHPEGFQLEAKGARAFVNIAGKGEVAVVERTTVHVDNPPSDRAEMKVIATWKLHSAASNYPMALDEATARG